MPLSLNNQFIQIPVGITQQQEPQERLHIWAFLLTRHSSGNFINYLAILIIPSGRQHQTFFTVLHIRQINYITVFIQSNLLE